MKHQDQIKLRHKYYKRLKLILTVSCPHYSINKLNENLLLLPFQYWDTYLP
ncbi:hypothetical protein E2C01_002493 [Portunus trituberculatus]|uniref:Uncharacterized protein n=1 Tax=Portunus trituberculatus TaxID=210409 RepID=A0A5B7CKQ2_PORTR|nr:hypothetical protein [Portunus trituberculatus]